eukprot:Gregarina_sp_Poly_1__4207@NODE_229_length_11141_cov_173_244537_g203_i0_p9_GENE_NODE_229_length_11141_cov_173_244537_g203_i0NODE_229_length_11141_cov_173_244537_g203_i0_p9_ORF_typecomplete_len100_score11_93DUF3703/PF12487_8/1_7DUF3703/PF12487_8/75_NODE_229_length_11141_cov_173_244537_g203_i0444743
MRVKQRLDELMTKAKQAKEAGNKETVNRLLEQVRGGVATLRTSRRLFAWLDSMRQTSARQLFQHWYTHPTRKWRLTINLWPFFSAHYDFCLRLLIDEQK